MPWSNSAHEPQLLGLGAPTAEACVPIACALQQEKPPQREAHAPQRGVVPTHHDQRTPVHSNEDPAQLNKLKKENTWLTNKTKKDAQHHQSLGKRKLNL